MSRAYRIQVSETLSRTIHVEDGISCPLELLDILPKESMAGLLAKRLGELGFEREGDKCTRQDDDGTRIVVDLTEGTVTVKISDDAKLDLEEKRSATSWEERSKRTESELRDAAKKSLEHQAQTEEQRLQQQVTQKLEKKLRDLKQELDRAANRTTADALKIRAAQLGEIQEIEEDHESGSMTIRVKV
ncbi:MAG: hypothetical protein HN348_20835 [Proteobacteria bacterium]|nr:hypothetical protein [Pseudomonadota bacterium]